MAKCPIEAGSELAGLFDSLQLIITDSYEDLVQSTTIEIAAANQGIENTFSSSFWKDLFSGDAAALQSELAASTSTFKASDTVAAGQHYNSMAASLFGGVSVVSQASANSLVETGTLLDNTQDTTFNGSLSACDNLMGLPGIIQDIATSQIDKLTTAAKDVQKTFTLLAGLDNTVPAAVSVLAGGALDKLLGVQEALLKQLKSEIQDLNEDIQKLDEDDYGTDHHLVIGQTIADLIAADNILQAQLNNVVDGFRLNRIGYETAQTHINEAKDRLCGIKLSDVLDAFPSARVLKITVRVLFIEELITLLRKSDENRQRVQFNLGFNSALEDLSHLDNLYAPVLRGLRCRLQVLVADMAATASKNNIATYLIREKLWCLELSVLDKLMDASRAFDVDLLKRGAFGEQWSDLTLHAASSDFNVSIDSIINAAELYLDNVKYKLSYNVNPAIIVARGELTNQLIDQRELENSSFLLILNGRTADLESNVLSGITLVNQLLAHMGQVKSLESVGTLLEEGDIKGFFESSTLYGQARDLLGSIGDALESLGCKLTDAGKGTVSAVTVLEDQTRADALFNNSLQGYNESYVRQVLQSDLPKANPRITL